MGDKSLPARARGKRLIQLNSIYILPREPGKAIGERAYGIGNGEE